MLMFSFFVPSFLEVSIFSLVKRCVCVCVDSDLGLGWVENFMSRAGFFPFRISRVQRILGSGQIRSI